MLDDLVPAPQKAEVNTVDLAAPPAVVWRHLRHGDLGDSPIVRALFALRTLPSRLGGRLAERPGLHIDDLRSTPEHPGFQLLGEVDGEELTVGAIGKVWQLAIPFKYVDGPTAYAAFAEPGWIKVAWAIRVEPLGDTSTRVVIEVRVDATDEASWAMFARYWHVIGPDDLATRLVQGPALLEPVGFAMDRRMLLGIRDRVLRRHQTRTERTANGAERSPVPTQVRDDEERGRSLAEGDDGRAVRARAVDRRCTHCPGDDGRPFAF